MAAYDPASFDPRATVPGLVARLRMAWLEELDQRLAPFDLKAQDYIVLLMVATGNDTASSICSVLALSHSSS